jgi:hypothetical protein
MPATASGHSAFFLLDDGTQNNYTILIDSSLRLRLPATAWPATFHSMANVFRAGRIDSKIERK